MNQSQQQIMLMHQLMMNQHSQSHKGYVMWPQNTQNTKPSGYNNRRYNTTSFGGNNNNNNNQQNRLKPKRYISKKKKFSSGNNNVKSAPLAPRNTTSFLIRAKKSGGITSLVSPCPVTPAVLPTPIFSPSREVLVDMAKEKWGVDGYGSMKGLIRLRSDGNEGGSSDSDVEEQEHEHLEVEKRLDHDLSRFEMVYPNHGGGSDNSGYMLENRVDDQDVHIARLEEENLIVKERLFVMEREFESLRMRLRSLETRRKGDINRGFVEEVVGNESETDSGSRGYGRLIDGNSEVFGAKKNNVVDDKDSYMEDGNQKREEKTDVVIEVNKIADDDDHVNGEKGVQGLEVLKGVGVAAGVHVEDDTQKSEEKANVNVFVEVSKIVDDDDHVNENAANGDSCVNQ